MAGVDVFVDHCGDEYIYGRQTGGDFTAIIRFSSTSQADQQTVSGTINGAIGRLVAVVWILPTACKSYNRLAAPAYW